MGTLANISAQKPVVQGRDPGRRSGPERCIPIRSSQNSKKKMLGKENIWDEQSTGPGMEPEGAPAKRKGGHRMDEIRRPGKCGLVKTSEWH